GGSRGCGRRSSGSGTTRSSRWRTARTRWSRACASGCTKSRPTRRPNGRSSTPACTTSRGAWTSSQRGRNGSVWCPTSRCRVRLEQSEKASTMPQTIDNTQTEREKVESWRLHVLIEAGYPLHLAEKVAHSEADLHRAVELVLAGCTFEVAAEILL